LERDGYRPSVIVGVSMGALVGVTYAMRADWYDAVMRMDIDDFPGPADEGAEDARGARRLWWSTRTLATTIRRALSLFTDWGPGAGARNVGLAEVRKLVGHRALNGGRIPVRVTATDLLSGERVVLQLPADDAVYASAALAGVLPPLETQGRLLADGAYSDLAPVDLARGGGVEVVIAVDAGTVDRAPTIRNGYHAIMRAMEICHRQHARLRFSEADLVLHPIFRRSVDVLDFHARRECVAAGLRAVRAERRTIAALLRRDAVPEPARP
jgi:NTE family protein